MKKEKEGEDKGMIIAVVAILCIILWTGFIVHSLIKYSIEQDSWEYEMPNGIICQDSVEYGMRAHEFKRCSDNKTYINPETYIIIK